MIRVKDCTSIKRGMLGFVMFVQSKLKRVLENGTIDHEDTLGTRSFAGRLKSRNSCGRY